MAIKVGDQIEFQTPDMINAETGTVESILSNQEGIQYYIFCEAVGHYKAIKKSDITFWHPTNR